MKIFSSRKLSPQATLSGLLVAIFLLIMGSTPGLATTYTWNTTAGDWYTGSNWSPVGPPGNGSDVIIDNNPSNTSVVNVNGGPTINTLTVDAGDTVNINAASNAVRSIDIGSGATITNNGAINLTTSGSNTARIYGSFTNGLLLTGSGTITLGTPNSIIGFSSGLVTLTNDTNHTIQGGGNIGGVGMYSFVNNGTVFANNNKNMLIKMSTYSSSYPGFNNQGTLRVDPGSTLEIQGQGKFSNYSSTALTGGSYEVRGFSYSAGKMTFPRDAGHYPQCL